MNTVNYDKSNSHVDKINIESELYHIVRSILDDAINPKSIFYTIRETSELIKCGRTKTFELIKMNRLHKVKLNSKTLITKSSVDALIAELLGQQGGGHAA